MASLFDGIGGFPKAGLRYGIKTLWASEIEPFPISVTKLRFPDMAHMGNICGLNGADLPPVDIVCGGSPCQDVSCAGRRAGLAGERSGLFFEQIRLVKELRDADRKRGRADESVRPRYMLWENVPGALSSGARYGEDFRVVLEEICGVAAHGLSVPRPPGRRWEFAGAIVGEEFSVAWRVVDAQYWYVPQRRKRIVLVADFGGHTANQILFEQDRLLGYFTPREEAREAAAAGLGARAPNAGGAPIAFAANQRDEVRDLHDVSAALCASQTMKQQTFIAESGSLTPWDTQQARVHTPDGVAPAVCGADGGGGRNPAGLLLEDADCLTAWDVQSRRIHSNDGVWPALYGGEGGGHGYVASFCAGAGAKAGGIGYQEETAPTLKAGQSGNLMPSVLCLNDQGGQRMDISDNMTGTLRSQMESHPPLVMATQQGGAEICEDLCPTITASAGLAGNMQPVVLESSAETYAISGNIIGRKEKNGGNGLGIQREISPTLTGTDKHCVCEPSSYQDVVGARCRGDEKGIGNQYVSQDKCIVMRNLIRRLTPKECERLMDFDDGWTDIPGCSDSKRYKALGNSVVVSCMEYVLRGITYFLRQESGDI